MMYKIDAKAKELDVPYYILLKYPKLADLVSCEGEKDRTIQALQKLYLEGLEQIKNLDYRPQNPINRYDARNIYGKKWTLPCIRTLQEYDIYMSELEHSAFLEIRNPLGGIKKQTSLEQIKRIKAHYPDLDNMRRQKLQERLEALHVKPSDKPEQKCEKEEDDHDEDSLPKESSVKDQGLLRFQTLDEEHSRRYNSEFYLDIIVHEDFRIYRHLVPMDYNGNANVGVIDIGENISIDDFMHIANYLGDDRNGLLIRPVDYGLDVHLINTKAISVELFKYLCIKIANELIHLKGVIASICFARTLEPFIIKLNESQNQEQKL